MTSEMKVSASLKFFIGINDATAWMPAMDSGLDPLRSNYDQ